MLHRQIILLHTFQVVEDTRFWASLEMNVAIDISIVSVVKSLGLCDLSQAQVESLVNEDELSEFFL